jgi:hypothetical protein
MQVWTGNSLGFELVQVLGWVLEVVVLVVGLCQMVRSAQPTGVLILVVYLFGGKESKAKNSKVAHNYVEHRQ